MLNIHSSIMPNFSNYSKLRNVFGGIPKTSKFLQARIKKKSVFSGFRETQTHMLCLIAENSYALGHLSLSQFMFLG